MPLYVDQAEYATLQNAETGAYYALDADKAGTKYIRQAMWPSGFVIANLPTKNQSWVVNATAPATGTAWATPLYLPGGFVVQTITFVSGTTAGGTLTHQWFGLADSTLKIVATTADDTSTAWAASTAKGLAIASVGGATAAAYKVPASTPRGEPALYYAVFLVTATTVPTLHAVTASAWSTGQVPKSGVTDLTSATVPAASDSSVTLAITANATVPLVGIS